MDRFAIKFTAFDFVLQNISCLQVGRYFFYKAMSWKRQFLEHLFQ